ncbi:low-density lipoprotein receptor-related protein 12-like [Ixodes scapularis]|uniref:low-density lipoprotein receptor-related protein 12-like n=1 Tax=Ixodes scapularis TaxID=6945 RepID=UPI001C38ED4D|nr:low-density lipoprotein receptor-related protein 12-like [Ixodes scapularis]
MFQAYTRSFKTVGLSLPAVSTTQEVCKGDSFTCLNSRCIWNGFSCDGKNNCGDDSDEKYFVNSMCIMPMAALVLIVTGIFVIVTSLLMICYCMMRLRTTIQKNMEEERANRARKKDSLSEGPYSEFVDTYGSQLPKPPLMSGAYQPSGDHTTGPYTRRSSTFPRSNSIKGRLEVSLYRRPYE